MVDGQVGQCAGARICSAQPGLAATIASAPVASRFAALRAAELGRGLGLGEVVDAGAAAADLPVLGLDDVDDALEQRRAAVRGCPGRGRGGRRRGRRRSGRGAGAARGSSTSVTSLTLSLRKSYSFRPEPQPAALVTIVSTSAKASVDLAGAPLGAVAPRRRAARASRSTRARGGCGPRSPRRRARRRSRALTCGKYARWTQPWRKPIALARCRRRSGSGFDPRRLASGASRAASRSGAKRAKGSSGISARRRRWWGNVREDRLALEALGRGRV